MGSALRFDDNGFRGVNDNGVGGRDDDGFGEAVA
jgi:hypothetical protein